MTRAPGVSCDAARMGAERRGIECERCGAAVPLVSASHARCVYCLHDQAVPPEMASAVQASAALDAQLEQVAGEGKRTFDAIFLKNQRWQVGLAIFTFVSCLPTFFFAFAIEGDTGEKILRGVIYGVAALGTGLMALIPIWWLRTLKRSGERAFAALPLARVSVDGGAFVAGCPSCGARLAAGHDVSVRCTHCQTESLLPQPLVDASLRERHKRVVELRVAGQEAMRDATTAAAAQWKKKVVPAIIGFNVLFGVIVLAAVLAYQLAKG